MEIYQSSKTKTSKTKNIYFFVFLAFCCFSFIGLSFIGGALAYRSGALYNIYHDGKDFLLNRESIWSSIWSTSYQLDHMHIDIKFKDLQKKSLERKKYLKHGYIANGLPNEYVPVKIRHNNRTYRAKLRFKGMMLDHVSHPTKWSYKIRLKDNQTLFGLREFSIQRPGTRNGIGEWLFMKLVASEGIATPYYDFVKVSQNGKYLGVFAVEGRFNQGFTDKNKLKEAPIIKFDPELFIKNKENLGDVRNIVINTDWSTYSDPITAHEINRMFGNTSFRKAINRGVALYESFRNQTNNVRKTFDIKKLAKYYALCDLTGSVHATQHSSMKAYYNPITDLLEPVAWDANAFGNIRFTGNDYGSLIFAEELARNYDSSFMDRRYEHRMLWLLKDKEFYIEYINQLNKFSREEFADTFFSKHKPQIIAIANHLQTSRGLRSFSAAREVLLNNQKYIRARLNPPKGLHAFFHRQDHNKITLSVGNIQYLPIEIINIQILEKRFYPLYKVELPRRTFNSPTDYQMIDFEFPPNISLNREMFENLRIVYKVVGMNKLITSEVFPHSNLDNEPVLGYILKQPPNHENFSFLLIDEQRKTIYIKSGKWKITKNIRFPAGYKILGGENTTLDLSNGAMIFSESPFELIGSEDAPVVLTSSDSTGKGLFIMKASKSVFKNVLFENLSNPSFGNWSLSGSLNFYKTAVRFEKCSFSNNRSEDALNIINSKFEIIDSKFHNIKSDAFDSDFSSGLLSDVTFNHIGNDAIDVSGTLCRMENITIGSVGDKGISAGEESEITLSNVQINNSEIGLVAKDLSTIRGNFVNISNTKLGIAVFQKKEEFGPGFIHLNNYNSNDIAVEYLIEKGSLLEVDQSKILGSIDNVKDLLYGREYGKKTKH